MLTAFPSDAYQASLKLLYAASTPSGFLASVQPISNYQRIWTRDGVITGLAALLTGDEKLVATFAATLRTIFEAQHPTGFFPSNVVPDTGQASYGGNCGRVDNVSWAIIGLLQYTLLTQTDELATRYAGRIEQAFRVLDAWEFNGRHLIYVPQSGDWADEYVQHGYVLYDQLLRVWALELAGRYWQRPAWLDQARAIRAVLVCNYWNEGDATDAQSLYAPNLRHQRLNTPRTFWLMGFNPSRVYAQFDLAANVLALLLDLGTKTHADCLLHYLQQQIEARQFLLPAYTPAILSIDEMAPELRDNYAYEFRNQPHQFHNGGLWPVWNGWLCAALWQQQRADMADRLCAHLSMANHLNLSGAHWGFYENLHGITHAPIGVPFCTWSAAGQLLAHSYRAGKRLVR